MAQSAAPAVAGISAREAEVLTALGEHLSNAEIAARLFISVRTVESHVSALLRKVGATDRRELADVAAGMRVSDARPTTAPLPSPLTSFVGRAQEREALGAALREHRQVTAVGPGGVGKTRLALSVIADAADRFPGGVWFVDLVPVTDPAMVAPAVAAALGAGEQQGRTTEATVMAALADPGTLLVLDNCEHVLDGVAPLVEQLLTACPGLTVLATSRARLLVPFEWVFPVPPLSLPGADGASDAVALFLERARAAGWPLDAADRSRVEDVCRALDGVALAIELAVARLPVLGIDGLHTGMSDQLRLLAGGPRADERHRSVRAVLDWSCALLDEPEQLLLGRVAVFAAPFRADAATRVAGFPPIDPLAVQDGLGHLAEQSLLTPVPTASGTRYRALETIRQYGLERLPAADLDETRRRHLGWCLAAAAALEEEGYADRARWRARFDELADDLRAALGWAAEQPEARTQARELAGALGRLAFARGLVREAQHRHEQAAGLADDAGQRAAALVAAAATAMCRYSGLEAYRLRQAAARAALDAGDRPLAAHQFAEAATMVFRAPGITSPLPSREEADELIAAARSAVDGDRGAEAAVLVAEVFRREADASRADSAPLAERAAQLAREAGDPITESAALDALIAILAGHGRVVEAHQVARQRLDVLGVLPVDATVGNELMDALNMAGDSSDAAGDLVGARALAQRLHDLPILVEEAHLATAQLIVTDALAGDVDAVRRTGERFREGWERAGRPPSAYLGRPTAAVAMALGLAGDDDGRASWLAMLDELGVGPERRAGYGATFDAILLLHRGEHAAALARLAHEPADLRRWISGMWRQWYAALKAEAAVLAGAADTEERLDQAQRIAVGNPIATAIVQRADALRTGDRAGLLAAASALGAAGSPYQQARTLVLAGGTEEAGGRRLLAELGIAAPG